ncbi:hypothetical protein PUMCH_004969 [Australozyma saopauloensis]|uniref:Uncharacterized protein n=1 Tax=Australozyma saopauloensis TaxID=291208 RepID=A0AAX4HGS8_9ASCO|nr:hypothetical protein PUMCH_004969 [[Candida] saopauloensis]
MITPIDAKDVSRITSGQVIIELVSAVKELIDNSIDAGADKIEVTFGEYGTKFLEITDNGCGIDVSDYEALCLKYHTSKLSSFEELSLVSSLGFRGEAMSSLCSVATISVVTSSKSTFPRATQLTYDNMGKLKNKKSSVTGKKGTSVTMTDLFKDLPVRLKNFNKHSKREYTKSLSLIIAYLLAYTNIRFTVFSIGANGRRQMVLGTPGGLTKLTDVMVSVYGSNGQYGLLPLEIEELKIEARFRLNTDYAPTKLALKLLGVISDSSFGMGRSSTDRQFISINKRPVVHKKLAKIINEVYRSFNATQSPVFVLNLELDTHFLDINITPDKRSVMIHTEELILDVIREQLTAFYESKNNVVPMSTVGTLCMGSSQNKRPRLSSRKESSDELENPGEKPLTPVKMESYMPRIVSGKSDTIGEESGLFVESTAENSSSEEEEIFEMENSDQEISKTIEEASEIASEAGEKVIEKITSDDETNSQEIFSEEERYSRREVKTNEELHTSKVPRTRRESTKEQCNSENIEDEKEDFIVTYSSQEPKIPNREPPVIDTLEDLNDDDDSDVASVSENKSTLVLVRNEDNPSTSQKSTDTPPLADLDDTEPSFIVYTLRADFNVNIEDLRILPNESPDPQATELAALRDINQTMEVKKLDFCDMRIVGQFNSGFIIVTHQDRLFIVDQHALDEIYNYERLMKSLVLRAQPLVVPRVLELSPIDEMRMLEFSSLLSKNGFKIVEDTSAPPGRKIRLMAVPVLKNVVFDDGDLHELVNKLHENCSLGKDVVAGVRCTKTERTIALRACRLSIMIGLALLIPTMESVVLHLSTLDRPWNCPHGRPTFRHLADLEGRGFQDDYKL